MAIVRRNPDGYVVISEMSIVETMSLSSIIIAGAKSPEISLKQVKDIKRIIDGLDLQMKEASKELSEASERLEKKLVEWRARNKN